MKKTCLTVALFLLLPAFAVCQSAGAAPPDSDDSALTATVPLDQQPSKEQLVKLFEVMRLREQWQTYTEIMPKAIQQQLQAQFNQIDSKLGVTPTPEQQAEMHKMMDKYMAMAFSIYTADDIISDVIPIYQRHFTKDEVNSLIAFYSTPAGQHMLALTPILMKEFMPVVMDHVQQRSQKLTDEMMNEVTAYLNKSSDPSSKPSSK